jgi:hypothetical protein
MQVMLGKMMGGAGTDMVKGGVTVCVLMTTGGYALLVLRVTSIGNY